MQLRTSRAPPSHQRSASQWPSEYCHHSVCPLPTRRPRLHPDSLRAACVGRRACRCVDRFPSHSLLPHSLLVLPRRSLAWRAIRGLVAALPLLPRGRAHGLVIDRGSLPPTCSSRSMRQPVYRLSSHSQLPHSLLVRSRRPPARHVLREYVASLLRLPLGRARGLVIDPGARRPTCSSRSDVAAWPCGYFPCLAHHIATEPPSRTRTPPASSTPWA